MPVSGVLDARHAPPGADAGLKRRIGFRDGLFGSALTGEQDAQRQKRNARIKPQRGVANIPVVQRAFFFLGVAQSFAPHLC